MNYNKNNYFNSILTNLSTIFLSSLAIKVELIFLLGSILLCSSLEGQCAKSEGEIKTYFEQNIHNLDPIEGIYSAGYKLKKYQHGKLVSERSEENCWKNVQILLNGSEFSECNSGKWKDGKFRRTTVEGVYTYSSSWSNSNAILTNNSFLEYSIKWPSNLIKNHYVEMFKDNGWVLSDSELQSLIRQTEIVVEINAIKIFPTEIELKKSAKSTGTGFAISSSGYIATCNHVIEGANIIKIRGINGNFGVAYSAEVIMTDIKNDVAILKVRDPNFLSLGTIPYAIKSTTSDVGSNIFLMGFPLISSMGDEIKLTNGIISAKSGFKGDITSYQLSAAAQPGNSGGPLFDSKGNLIGVVNAKHVAAENATYAVKIAYLINLLESLPTTPVLQNFNSLSKKTLPDQVKAIKNFVYIIEVN